MILIKLGGSIITNKGKAPISEKKNDRQYSKTDQED